MSPECPLAACCEVNPGFTQKLMETQYFPSSLTSFLIIPKLSPLLKEKVTFLLLFTTIIPYISAAGTLLM